MRILLVSNTTPLPMTNGGQQRTYHLLEALRSVGEVDLLLVPRYAPPDEKLLAELRTRYGTVEVAPTRQRGEAWPWKWLRPLSPERVDRLANALGDRRFYYRTDAAAAAALKAMMAKRRYDVFIARYAQSAGVSQVLDAASPVIVDIDDLDAHVVATNLAAVAGQPLKEMIFRRQLRQLNTVLPRMLAKAAHCWVTTLEDGESVETGRFSVLPNIPLVEPTSAAEPAEGCQRIVMVGNMYFRPNVEGAAFFVEKVWPLVVAAHPRAEFRIIGQGLDAALVKRWEQLPGLKVVGWVDRLAPEYEAAAFSVVPVVTGGGTKIKVLESLAYRRTCVITSHALRGYEQTLKQGDALFVADTPEAFAEHCNQLLDDPQRRRDMAERGKRVVEASYSTTRFVEIVKRDLVAVVEVKPLKWADRVSAVGLSACVSLFELFGEQVAQYAM
jgi:glycosyltransferase involved in cell wall biosynthesis